jgi:hypothetical protein
VQADDRRRVDALRPLSTAMPPPGSELATTPVEEKVVTLERRAGDGHGKQYGLKMLGAGLSSASLHLSVS